MKLNAKIAMILCTGGTFVAAALFSATYNFVISDAEGEALGDGDAIANNTLGLIDQLISDRRSGFAYIASNIVYPATESDSRRVRAQLERFIGATGVWTDIVLRDLQGKIVIEAGAGDAAESALLNPAYAEAFRAAREGDVVSTDVLRVTAGERPVIVMLAPVYAAGDRSVVRGVLDARLAWESVFELLGDVPPPYTAHLLNKSGLEIGSTETGAAAFGISHGEHAGVRQLSRAERVRGTFPSLRGAYSALFVFAYEPGYLDYRGNEWVLAVETPRAPVVARGRAVAIEFGGLLLGSIFIAAMFVAYFIRRYIIAPVVALSRGAEHMVNGTFAGFAEKFFVDEIGALAGALDALWKKTQTVQLELSAMVREQTTALEEKIRDAQEKNSALESTKRAIVNVLDDLRGQEALLKAERDKLDVTLRAIGDGVFVVDRWEVVTFFNSAAEGLTAYAAGDVVGKPYQEVLKFSRESDGEVELKFIDEVLFGEHALRVPPTEPLMLTRKNNARIAVAASATPLRDERGATIGVVVVFRDVSHEREIDRAKSEFISLATHQLRTPLTTMKWIPEMLLEGAVGKFSPKQRKYIDDLRRSSERLIQLINKLLVIARIESRRVETTVEDVGVRKFLENIKKDFTREAESRKQRLVFHAPKVASLRTDPRLLSEIVRNLLANAMKYTPDGGRIEVAEASAPHGRVLFTVKDNGIGIPKAQQQRIFGKFFRADNAAKTDVMGTGLGLYVVRRLTDILGGMVEFTSEENKGTTFTVTLPVSGPKPEKGGV